MAGVAAWLISLAFSCDISARDGAGAAPQGVCAQAGAALATIERQAIAMTQSELAGRRKVFISARIASQVSKGSVLLPPL